MIVSVSLIIIVTAHLSQAIMSSSLSHHHTDPGHVVGQLTVVWCLSDEWVMKYLVHVTVSSGGGSFDSHNDDHDGIARMTTLATTATTARRWSRWLWRRLWWSW